MELAHRVEVRPHTAEPRVHDVHCGHAGAQKRRVVVDDAGLVLKEVLAVAEVLGRLRDVVLQPRL